MNPLAPLDVWVASATVGAGHNQVSRAIIETLRQLAPSLTAEMHDSIQFGTRFFRWYYQKGFHLGMTRLPRVYGGGFVVANRPHKARRGLSEMPRLLLERRFLRQLPLEVERRSPRLIINAHFLATPIFSRLIDQGRLCARQIVVVTDIDVHRWWYSRNVDHWFVPHEESKRTVLRWGVDESRITVSGIPIMPKWSLPVDKEQARRDWSLPEGLKIVLLSGGTEFVCGPIVKIANSILRAREDAAVVVMAGRNKQLLADLSQQPLAGKRLFPVAFTDKGHELVALSSLMVTKPGGVTTAECLSAGVPMVLLRPVPGQEGGNAKFLARHNAAVITRRTSQVITQVNRLLSSPADLAAMSQAARELHRPGAQAVAQYVARELGQNTNAGKIAQ